MPALICRPACLFLALVIILSGPAPTAASARLSRSGICHDAGSSSWTRTKDFEAFATMAECLAHGRAYKGWKDQAPASAPAGYDRALYGGWTDADGNCRNTRHDLLAAMSTAVVKLNDNSCAVLGGRWLDPYTGRIFTQPGQLDIDHVVPLAWAHERGAALWPEEQRVAFANDAVNLLAVEAAANRAKGARGPLDWLPPDSRYHCEYVTRFHRIVLTWKLQYHPGERARMDELRRGLCG